MPRITNKAHGVVTVAFSANEVDDWNDRWPASPLEGAIAFDLDPTSGDVIDIRCRTKVYEEGGDALAALADDASRLAYKAGKVEYGPNPPVRRIGQHVHDFDSAKRFLGNREERKLANNTIIAWRTKPFQDGGGTIGVRLHGTWIVQYHEDGTVTLDSGGWETTTTKQRINQLLPPPFGISQEKFKWWLHLPGGKRVAYHDGMTVNLREGDMLPNPPRKKMATAEPGSISTGTLKSEDLLSAFTEELERLYSESGGEMPRHVRKLIDEAGALDTEDEDPFNAEVVNDVIDELMDELEHFAPAGYYFGAHPGDGADFGYWPVED